MKFNSYVHKILEGFNIFPQAQTAPSTGPDQGMTKVDPNNTFPSKISTVLLAKKKKKRKKTIPRQ